jgi:hypothetical protein
LPFWLSFPARESAVVLFAFVGESDHGKMGFGNVTMIGYDAWVFPEVLS